MSDSDDDIISEPTISYSYTSSNNFSSGSLKPTKKIGHNLSFTPLWKSDINNSFSEIDSEKDSKKRKSAFFQQKDDNSEKNSFFRVSTYSDLRRIPPPKVNKIHSKKSDLTEKYDELIEKLKRSPPQLKPSYTQDSYYNNFNLDDSERNIKIKQKNTRDDFSIAQKRFSSPLIFDNDRRRSVQYNFLLFNEEKLKNLTNTEDISDFYEYTERCMEMILDLDKSKQKSIKEKVNLHFPEKESKKKIALFDLDETLAHCVGEIKDNQKNIKPYKHIVNVTLPSRKKTKIGINIRPNWEETMDLIQQKYQIVIYTASHQSYADAVLNYMDPEKKYTKYRLYRNNCVQAEVDGRKFYIKDLSIFDKYYDLKNIVIIDNSVLSFAYHLNNGIPIVPYYDSEEDSELTILGYYLITIYDYDDLREANKAHIRIGYYLEKARKDREEEEREEEEKEEEEKEEELEDDDNEDFESINNEESNNTISENENENDESMKKNENEKDKLDNNQNNENPEKRKSDKKHDNNNEKRIECKNKKSVSHKKFDRSQTISIKLINKKEKNIPFSPEKNHPKRKNSGLNIVNIWKGIRRQMSTLN